MGAKIPKNYVNNKDLLREIFLSKNTYCTFLDPISDSEYDIILNDINDIEKKVNIQKARESYSNRHDIPFVKSGKKVVPITSLVFRIMTNEHVPMVPKKKKNPPKDEEVMLIKDRVNFPPFFHYRLSADEKPYLVGKSHWKVEKGWNGDFSLGHFCKDHGHLTDNLSLMIMKMAEKCSLMPRWRNYSYRDEMIAQAILQLVQVALQFDESRSSNPFAFFTQISKNSFFKICGMEFKNQQLRDELLVRNHKNPSYSRANRDANTNYDGSYGDY